MKSKRRKHTQAHQGGGTGVEKRQSRPGGPLQGFWQSLSVWERILSSGEGLKQSTAILIISILTVACLIPFSSKAFHIDDPLFIWTAKHIQSAPLDPYGFNVNWYGTEKRMAEVAKNPPLASYYISFVASLLGWSEILLHVAFIIPALAVTLGTYLLARNFCRNQLLASLLALFTPVFLLSSTTVMSDMMMLAFWVFAIYFWLRGMKESSSLFFLVAAVLIPICALTKYFGIALIPLLLLYSILKHRRLQWWAIYMLIPIIVLGWYQWATHSLYGRGLLLDAASYATGIPSQFGKWSIPKVLVGLAFTGGCVAVILFFSRLLWSWKEMAFGVLLTLVIAGAVASARSIGAYPLPTESAGRWATAIQFGLFAGGGISLLVISALDFMRRRTAESLLLVLWIVGTFIFAAFINWTTNGRSILPLVPATAIVMTRRMEERLSLYKKAASAHVLLPLVGAALISLAVTWADFQFANSSRMAASRIHDRFMNENRTVWFQGHWGFQYYMESVGGKPIDVRRSRIVHGDIVIIPTTNTNLFRLPSEWARPRERLEVPVSTWITTMNTPLGAGFYADRWGPLPFALGSVAAEQYHVFDVSVRAPGQ